MGMPIEVRDRWVAALRSGQYEQGKDQLRDNGQFCCLGVLCDVVGFDLDGPSPDGGTWSFATGDDDPCDPPLLVSLLDQKTRGLLAKKNDHGASFAEIADYIEQNVPVS